MKIIPRFALFLSSLMWIITISLQAQIFELPQDSDYLILSDFSAIHDVSQQINEPQDAIQALSESANSSEIFDLSVSNYWIQFSVVNSSSRDNEWLADFAGWSYVDFYIQNGNNSFEKKVTGHFVPYNKRDYAVGNKNHVLLKVNANDTMHYLARLEFQPDNFNAPTDLSVKLGLRSTLDASNYRIKLNTYIFIGIFFVMLLYHLFIYSSTRNVSYLYYIGIVGLMIYMIANNSGYLIEVFKSFESLPRLRNKLETTVSSGIPILMIFFTMSILNTKQNMPRVHKVMRVMLWLILVLTILVVISFETFGFLVSFSTLVVVITFLTAGITAVIRKLPSGRYYLIAYTFSLAGVIIMFASLSGGIPRTDFTLYYSMPLGYTLEILFYSLALANIINVLKKENAENQARIIAQLQENQELQTKVNRELETKVAERTKEIRKQSEIIEIEKEKSDALLLNILPESTAEELKTNGFATTKAFKNVSVMFTDFKDFTKICENMSPKELVSNLDTCFKKFDDITSEFNLEKIKTIGDSYMCAEGIPDEDKSNPENMIKAAHKILNFIDEWNKEKEAKGEPVWPIRIGINSGPITAGVVGKKKFAYDIWGDTVNLASRMESAGVPGKVNVSEFTKELVKDKFTFISRGEIPAKNYGDVEMFFVEPSI